MIIPKLKRIKVSTEQDLRNWLRANTDQPQEVMIVTCNKASPNKHIPSARVRSMLQECGWQAGRSYTLEGNLDGHIAVHD